MADGTGQPGTPDVEPLLRVVHGEPTDEELAALLALVRLRNRTPPPALVSGPSAWVRSLGPGTAVAGPPAAPGPDAWRGSALPG